MKPREARFFGSGNVALEDGDGKHRKAWQIHCRLCSTTATVNLSTRGLLPPNVVVKKFHQQGWTIGGGSGDDLCPECREQAVARLAAIVPTDDTNGTIKLLRQQYQSVTAARVRLQTENSALHSQLSGLKNSLASAHVQLIREVHEHLLFERIDAALDAIEAAFPHFPWSRPAPKEKGSVKPQRRGNGPDPDFERWLNDLQQQHVGK